MIKHKPKNKTNVRIGDKIYLCNRSTGVVELPDYYIQFNPIEEKIKPKKVAKYKDLTDVK